MTVSELIIDLLKKNIGERIGFFTENRFYFEGDILDCDGVVLKYNDRKTGIKIIEVEKIKEVSLK